MRVSAEGQCRVGPKEHGLFAYRLPTGRHVPRKRCQRILVIAEFALMTLDEETFPTPPF